MGVPMRVVVWGYRGGVGTLRIPYKLSTYTANFAIYVDIGIICSI